MRMFRRFALATLLLIATVFTNTNCGGDGDSPTGPPPPCLEEPCQKPTPTPPPVVIGPCQFSYGCDRLGTTAEGLGIYRCETNPAGLGVSLSVLSVSPGGQLVYTPVGDPRGLVFASPGSAILPCLGGCCIQGLSLP